MGERVNGIKPIFLTRYDYRLLKLSLPKKLTPKHHFSASLEAQYQFVRAGISAALETLKQEGAITVKVFDFTGEADEMDHARCLQVQRPYLGNIECHYTDWTPTAFRINHFAEDRDDTDPWQFTNFLVV